MACFNKNTKEYIALKDKYKDVIIVEALITNYQQASQTDMIPSISEVEDLLEDKKAYFSLQKKNFENSVYGNLNKKRLVAKLNGKYYVVNTILGETTGSIKRAKYNVDLIQGYLKHHNFENSLNYKLSRNGKTFEITFNNDLFNVQDIIAESPYSNEKYKDQTNVLQLVDSIVEKFPGLRVKVMSVKESEFFLNTLPVNARPNKLDFKKVKSFYYDGLVILIKGRITKNIAIEEVLHPFVESLFLDNRELFNKLYSEAKINFPELNIQIEETYKTGFNQKIKALELVTQALVRHFNKEYESTPNRAWYNSIIEFLKWFKDIVGDYYRKYVGQGLPLKTEYISSTATLSDIAKILNTDQLKFNLVKSVSPTVMFSLTPQAKSNLDAIEKHANPTQLAIINNLFNNLKSDEFDHDILGLNRITLKDGKYQDVDDTDIIFKSTEEAILGGINVTNKNVQEDIQTLLNALTTQTKIEDLDLKYLSDEAAKKMMSQISSIIYGYGLREDRSVFISNVVIGNSENSVADTIDLLKIDTKGIITPISIAISDLSSFSAAYPQNIIPIGGSKEGVAELFESNPELSNAVYEALGFNDNNFELKENKEAFGKEPHPEGATTYDIFSNGRKIGKIALFDGKNPMIKGLNLNESERNKGLGKALYKWLNYKATLKGGRLYADQEFISPDAQRVWESLNKEGLVDLTGNSPKFNDKQKQQAQSKFQEYINVTGKQDIEKFKNFVSNIQSTSGVTTKMFNDTRSALQRRLLENMGYKLTEDTLVMHIHAEQNGYNVEGITNVKSTVNQSKIEEIAPLSIDQINMSSVEEILEMETPIEASADFLTVEESLPENNEDLSYDMYDALFKPITKFDKGLLTSQEVITNVNGYLNMNNGKKEILEEISLTRAMIAELHDNPDQIKKIYVDIISQSLRSIEKFKEYAQDPDNFSKPEYISKILGWQKFVESYRGLVNLSETNGLNKSEANMVFKLQKNLNELVGLDNPKTPSDKGIFDASIRNYVRTLIKDKSQRDFTEAELNEIMTTVKDIGVISQSVGRLDTSDDPISAIMAKIWKRDSQIVLDRIRDRAPRIKASSLKLRKLNNKDFMWMIDLDENGIPTGRYVKEIGTQYYAKRKEYKDKLYDNGTFKTYRLIDPEHLSSASEKDKDYNKQLWEYKINYRDFMKAERWGQNGPIDGKYHRYSKKFKTEREKYEVFWIEPETEYGYWVRKNSVNDKDWNTYRNNYYDSFEYERAVLNNDGMPTGAIVMTHMTAPKKKYTEIRPTAADGTSMTNPKWTKLQNPTTELERAQLEFYEMWIDVYEDELLKKLPDNVKMNGKLPVMEGVQTKKLKDKSTIIGRMWASIKRSTSDLIHPSTTIKKTFTDEFGNIITDSLPLLYTGSIQSEEQLTQIQNQIDAKNLEYKETNSYEEKKRIDKELAILKGEQRKIESKPTHNTLNLNLDEVLLKFSAMAENYEVMSQAEDTYTAMIKVMEDRTDSTVDKDGNVVAGPKTKGDSKRVQRVRKWMQMTYYGNDNDNNSFFDKIVGGQYGLINQTSLAYVGFNVFGNLNNYLFGRLSNAIETAGSRHFDGKQMFNTVAEFNSRMSQDLFAKLAKMPDSNSDWKPANFNSKYLATVDFFRMMDQKSDLREQTKSGEGWYQKLTNWGFFLQDAGEFNVQSKVGNAILRSHTAINSKTGETKSLYDALIFNRETGDLVMEEGYDQVQMYNREKIMPWNDDARYEIRNNIREVNIQIHGNYAHADRMAIQSHSLGKLAAQFHKWVVPGLQARFRPEYFDENLGWLEGRYLTFWNFLAYTFKNVKDIGSIHENYKKAHGNQGKIKLQNAYRTIGELGLFATTIIIKNILIGLFSDDDDDDSEVQRKLQNVLVYQADRLRKELVTFNPIPGMGGYQQIYQIFKSPIAATRTLGELGEALEVSVGTGLSYVFSDDTEFTKSKYVYQRGNRKGEMKLGKEWGDALPILYTINRWHSYDNIRDFYIK